MKHLFVINPAAGRRDSSESIERQAESVMRELGFEYEIYHTDAPMDASEYVRKAADTGERIRVYACGGDGTLNEVVNGAAMHENAEVTNYPCGTGNDFIKTFTADASVFRDIKSLALGESRALDLIKVGDRYGVNICSVGVDARIGGDVHKYSGIPVVGGKGGYIVSLIVNLMKGVGREMTVSVDSEAFPRAKYSLVCCCSGRYYGGSFNPVPDAMPDDGALDMLVVKNVSRRRFLRLVGRYSKGRYREMPEVITYRRGRDMTVSAPEEFPVNIDGEIIRGRKAHFEIVPSALRFVLPKGLVFP